MKIALISDIHSNVEALTTALESIDDIGVDAIFCLGDVVGYGADPNPCCDILRERCELTLLGNHDAAAIGVMDIDYYYPAARDAIFWTRRQLSPENFEWLYSLPYTAVYEEFALYHSAPARPSGFYYVVQDRDAEAHVGMHSVMKRWNFIGHSHLTTGFAVTPQGAFEIEPSAPGAPTDAKFIVNVGSVGQPRDRDNRLCFGIYDLESDHFQHVRVAYDIPSAARKIEEAGLDSKFATRLFTGN